MSERIILICSSAQVALISAQHLFFKTARHEFVQCDIYPFPLRHAPIKTHLRMSLFYLLEASELINTFGLEVQRVIHNTVKA